MSKTLKHYTSGWLKTHLARLARWPDGSKIDIFNKIFEFGPKYVIVEGPRAILSY